MKIWAFAENSDYINVWFAVSRLCIAQNPPIAYVFLKRKGKIPSIVLSKLHVDYFFNKSEAKIEQFIFNSSTDTT
jgi:hypothetical protein